MELSSSTTVAFVDCQDNVTVWPAVIVVRSALNETDGGSGGAVEVAAIG
jgi:hypothetical protein